MANQVLGYFNPTEQKTLWFNITARPLYTGAKRRPDRALVLFSDISRSHAAEHDLTERNKEMRAFLLLGEISERDEYTIEEIYQHTVEFLPGCFQYPDIACAKIGMFGRTYHTSNYRKTEWVLATPVQVRHEVVGAIEIGYLAPKPALAEGPFMQEERILIDAISERLGRITERKLNAATLHRQNDLIQLSLSAAKLGTWQQDFTKNELVLDDIAREHLGFDKPVVKMQDIFRKLIPEDVKNAREFFERMLSRGDPEDDEQVYRIHLPDGRVRWLEIHSRVKMAHTENGPRPVAAVGTSQDITQRVKIEHDLNERIKELKSFYALSELSMLQEISLNTLYQHTVDFLPQSWQYPEAAWARIEVNNKEFKTSNYRKTAWVQSAPITIGKLPIGTLEVGYLQKRPPADEGPFLIEERKLLNSIAERLSRATERKQMDEVALQASDMGRWQQNLRTNEIYLDTLSQRHFGLSGEVHKISEIFEKIHPEDAARVMEQSRAAVKTVSVSPVVSEFRVVREDGSYRWVSLILTVDYSQTEQGLVPSASIGTVTDITDRKLREQELFNYRAKLEAALSSMTDAVFITDPQRNFVEFNDAFATFHKFPNKAATVKDLPNYPEFLEMFFPDGTPAPVEKWALSRALRGETGSNVEYQLHRKDIDVSWYGSYSFAPIKDSNNQIVGAVVVCRDISDMKRIQSQLQEANANYSLIAENVYDVIWVWDVERERYVYISPSVERMHGYTPAEAMTLSFTRVLTPSSAAQIGLLVSQAAPLLYSGQSVPSLSLELDQIRKDGVVFPTDTTVALVLNRFNKIQLIGITRDITKRKQADEELRQANARYRLIAENVNDVIWVLDVATEHFTYISPSVENLRGFTPEEALQESMRDVLTPESYQLAASNLTKNLANLEVGQPLEIDPVELVQICKDGSLVPTEVRASLVRDDQGMLQVIGVSRDISERKRAEAQLLTSEQRSKTIVDAIPDILFRVSRDGTFLDYQSKMDGRLYAPPEAFIGKKLTEVLPPEVARQGIDAIRLAFEEDRLQSFQYNLSIDEDTLIYEARVVANRAEQEAVIIVRDITEQRKMENEIRQSEEKYRLLSEELEQRVKERTAEVQDLYDHAPTGYHSLDENGIFQMMNQTELDLLGYTHDEIVGKKRLVDVLTPDSVQIFHKNFPVFKQKGVLNNVEFEFVRKDGEIIPVIINALALFDKQGNYMHSRSTVFDNTELKKIQAEISRINNFSDTALELAKAGYWYIELGGESDIYTSSDRLIQILGDDYHADHIYELDNEWLGNMIAADPDLAKKAQKALDEVIEGRKDRYEAEYEYRRPKDGRVVWIHDIGNVVFDSAGNRVGISGVCQDVTQQKTMENELKKAREAAENANKAKSVFLANMSHEIRTPMNAILGFAQIMMKDEKLDARNRSHIETINRSGEHLLTLINEILEMSKIEAGHVTYNAVTFNLISLLKDICSMFQPRVDAKKLKLTLDLSPNMVEYVVSDEIKMKEILINVIGNAVKFTDEGGITISCKCSRDPLAKDPGKIILNFDVADTGVGIPTEDIPRLFQAFEQTRSGAQMVGGTGLGLAISQSHARLMGGEITVTSEPGKGSVFHIRMAATRGRKFDLPIEAPIRKVNGILPETPKVKVLIVDDHPDNRKVLREFLEPIGISTREAENGIQAVELTESWRPNIILMDIRMPGLNGFEAARLIKLKPENQDIHLIAVTASILDLDKEKVTDSGMTGYLRKPFRENDLFNILEEKLGNIFTYSEQARVAPAAAGNGLSSGPLEDVATLPPELIGKIRQAAVNAQFDQLLNAIEAIRGSAPRLSNHLRNLTNNFQYDALLKEIEPGKEKE